MATWTENWLALLLLCFLISSVIYFAWCYLDTDPTTCVVQRDGQCNYGYGLCDGPHTWTHSFSLSNGQSQSPVNIEVKRVRSVANARPLFVRKGYEEMPNMLLLQNTGLTVEMTTCCPHGPPSVFWSIQPSSKYELSIITFRWPSEHTIDFQHYPLEIQAIHVLCSDPLKEPKMDSPRLLILSYLFAETPHANPYLDPVSMHLETVSRAGDQQPMQPFPLSWLCPDLQSGYYQYSGSLTFPPCSESVNWLISTRIGHIGTAQLARFGMVCDHSGYRIMLNQRPVQPLNGRPITLNQLK